MGKPVICIDFDGVIHDHSKEPWAGEHVINGPVIPGAMKAIVDYHDGGYDVAIFSSRSATMRGVSAMRTAVYEWLLEYFRPEEDGEHNSAATHQKAQRVYQNLLFPSTKPPAFISIDDRAYVFTGVFPTTEDVKNFRPWYKNEPASLLRDSSAPDASGGHSDKAARSTRRTSPRG